MIAALTLAASVMALVHEPAATETSTPAVAVREDTLQDPVQDPQLYRLEEIVVEGRRLDTLTRDFVHEVAAPPRGRGIARWRDGVCVGVANFDPEVAQYLVDRVSDVARDLGLRAGQPGCEPSILIIGTTDGAGFARQFVASRPRLFRVGGAGMDRGRAALDRFMGSDAPVRWWHVSLPVDAESGLRAVRLPGDHVGSYDRAFDVLGYAPQISSTIASRIQSSIEDVLKRSFVIIDVDRLDGVNLQQLGDYVAMVALVQINPDADTHRYETVLNLFDDPEGVEGLSGWDLAYMEGIYAVRPGRISTADQVQSITQAIVSAYRRQH